MSNADHAAYMLAKRSESCRAEWAPLFTETIACFKAWKLRVVGRLRGALVVVREENDYDLWSVSDNCGELNAQRINDMESLRSVPYDVTGTALDGATMAYRVRCVLDGEEIDYARRLDDCLDVMLEIGRESA